MHGNEVRCFIIYHRAVVECAILGALEETIADQRPSQVTGPGTFLTHAEICSLFLSFLLFYVNLIKQVVRADKCFCINYAIDEHTIKTCCF